jgi:hypothetical protein
LAKYDDIEKILTYIETVEYSGNSTIQVVILNKAVVTNDIRNMINLLGCESEKFQEGYFVIDVPAEKDYKPLKRKLSDLQEKGIIDYAESCLSDNHRY